MKESEKVYCAFCRLERKVYSKKHVNWTNVLMSFSMTILLDLSWVGPFSAKSIFVFVFLMCLAEFFIQMRWRLGLPCPYCHFDPVLYLTNRKLALERVKQQLERVKQDEIMKLSSKNPLRKLPVKKVKSKDNLSRISALQNKVNESLELNQVSERERPKIGWTQENTDVSLKRPLENPAVPKKLPSESHL